MHPGVMVVTCFCVRSFRMWCVASIMPLFFCSPESINAVLVCTRYAMLRDFLSSELHEEKTPPYERTSKQTNIPLDAMETPLVLNDQGGGQGQRTGNAGVRDPSAERADRGRSPTTTRGPFQSGIPTCPCRPSPSTCFSKQYPNQ